MGHLISRELKLLNEQKPIETIPYEKKTWVKSDVVEMLTIKALENDLKPKYLITLANCESSLDPSVQSKYIQPYGREESYGLFQIHTRAHTNITVEEAKDPEFNTDWAIQEIKRGKAPQHWVHCNKIAKQYS